MKILLSEEMSIPDVSPAPDFESDCSPFAVEQYDSRRKEAWDDFLAETKNSSFLFHRDYMDYHRDRFEDHSLLIFLRGHLVAVLPANRTSENELVSHQGLSYGGLVVHRDATLMEIMACFHALLRYLHSFRIEKLLYKEIPAFYNSLPGGEVAYCLFLVNARLYRRDCALVIPLGDRLPIQKRRRRQVRRAATSHASVAEENVFTPFWERVLVPRLAARYGVAPVHSVEEITLLASRFPENIKQFSVYCDGGIVAGATVYETPRIAHAQYIASTDQGRKIGALDFLFNWLIEERYRNKVCFDFGISNENEGRSLNFGLLDWKEGFGARCSAHNFYEIATGNYVKLEPLLQQYTALNNERHSPIAEYY
jgi:Acetyltransferase (GNAT) domain